MRSMMKENEKAYRAVALWIDKRTNEVLYKVIVGPYSRPGTAKGSVSQEINGYYGKVKKYEAQVNAGEVVFNRWVEESATVWTRL